ncbi:MAG TPA: PA14 domain-containing protein [Tepidisphaeraceae bacterium]|nr:PA14 domain-containing protein [Tepidisphaeraceae bacterium]
MGSTIVQAENFDTGGQGNAYNDTTASNLGGQYRTGEAVDLYSTNDAGGGYKVGSIAAGEWLGYTINPEAAHRYDITVRVASSASVGTYGGHLHLEFGPQSQIGGAGVTRSGLFVVKGTGSSDTFADVTIKGIMLPAGTQWMRLVADTGNFDANHVRIAPAGHSHNAAHESDHNAILDLVPTGTATHVAIRSGDWTNPTTWLNGVVPAAGARAWVPNGQVVTYNVASNPVRLNTLRVDGVLNFATAQNTHLLVDTFVVAEAGTLNIGTAANPVNAANTALIQFSSGTAIDFNVDRSAISRGLIVEGIANIHGANKTDRVTLGNVSAGATSLTFEQDLTGWRVGDRIVLTGTSYNANGSDADNSRFRDEVLTIQSISGRTITFTNQDGGGNALRFAHSVPAGYGFKVHAGNLTRNVTFETENWRLATTADNRRGHTMFTGPASVNVNNASFYGLGRTSKDVRVTDPDKSGSGATYNNARGRYAVHMHHLSNNTPAGIAAVVDGCVVENSSGWGYALHSSKGNFNSNVSYDVLGAHFMTEEGTELGSFTNNLAIKARGSNASDIGSGNGRTYEPNAPGGRAGNHDFGSFGNGIWLQGGGLFVTDGNVVASAAGPAFEVYGDADDVHNSRNPINPDQIADLTLRNSLVTAYGANNIKAWHVPWQSFSNNTASNSYSGFQYGWQLREAIGPRSPVRNVLDNFKSWGTYGSISQIGGSVRSGSAVSFVYAGFLSVTNSTLVGTSTGVADPTSSTQKVRIGIDVNYNPRSIRIENTTVVGFDQGVLIPFDGDQEVGRPPVFRDSWISGGSFNNRVNILPGERLDPNNSFQPVPNPIYSYLELRNNPSFTVQGSNTLPTATFTSAASDGLTVRFDGSGSSDVDAATTAGNRIAAYGWDFDNNGTIDAWGEKPTHTFTSAGAKVVRLTVWDNKGATNSINQSVSVAAGQVNALTNGDFSSSMMRQTGYHPLSTKLLTDGSPAWYTFDGGTAFVRQSDGTLQATTNNTSYGAFQLVRNDKANRGSQTVRFDYRNTEGGGAENRLRMLVYGVNASGSPYFDFNRNDWYTPNGVVFPRQFGSFPFAATTLYDSGDVATANTGWTNHSVTRDFGGGYEFLIVRFERDGVGSGDLVSIDNVSIASSTTTPNPTAPAAPSNLAATATSASQINLTWNDNSGNETGFIIERSTSSSFASPTAITVGANVTSYANTGLSAATPYYYRVRATNAAGSSANSAMASATTQPATNGTATVTFSGPVATDGTYTEGNYKFFNRGSLPYNGSANLTIESGGGSQVVRTQDWGQRLEARRGDNGGFTLTSFQVRRVYSTNTVIDIVGKKVGSTQTVTRAVDVTSDTLTTITLDATWSDLEYVWFTPRNIGSGAAYAHYDNFAFGASAPPAPSGTGLSATYYDNMDFTGATVTRIDGPINFDWGNGSPATEIGLDTYSARWTGEVQAEEAGNYVFRITGDDGIRLYVNEQLVASGWINQAPTSYDSAAISFGAGEKKSIRMEYYENTGGAVARLLWQRPGQTTFQAIPAAQLYADGGTAITASVAPVIANRATGGTATASGQNVSANEGAAQAFDGTTATKWLTFSPTGWLQYQFANDAARTVRQYIVRSGNDAPTRDPRNWTLLGSNDNSSWSTLDSRSNQTWPARLAGNMYTVATPGAYKFYRLNVTANSGDGMLQLSELELLA